MRVIQFSQRGQAELINEAEPQCSESQILIRTEYSGISNGTERSFLIGGPYGSSKWPCRCGYQTVGRVIEVGRAVKSFKEGDRVFSGKFGHHAELHAVEVADPEHPANLTALLPDAIDPICAALFGVAGVSMHDVRQVRTGIGDRALVVGAGLIGQFAAQAAQLSGAETFLANRSGDRLEVASSCGIRHVVQISGDEIWQQLRDPGFDVVIEASGANLLDYIIGRPGKPGILRSNGRLFLSAGRFEVAYSCLAAQMQRLEIYHTTHFRRNDLIEVIRLAAEGAIQVKPMIRDVVPVERAPEIYRFMRDEPRRLLGTVFQWT